MDQYSSLGRFEAFNLPWLPPAPEWTSELKAVEQADDRAALWRRLVALANARMDFTRTVRLDRALQKLFGSDPPAGLPTKPVRLAVLGSSTLAHLLPAIRVAALRRGLWLTTYETDYGQYLQELNDAHSGLHRFVPNTVLFAFDTPHLVRGADAGAGAAEAAAALQANLAHLVECWRLARNAFGGPIIQQTALPVFPALLGNNEHRLPGSPARLAAALNEALRDAAENEGVDLLALDLRAASDGIGRWHDPSLWHRAKQEVSPAAAPLYGDLVARLIAAQQGRSYKCLVLDLDNTLWGGVVGDDGLDGIVIGQGSALGEAFLAFQAYVRSLSRRGIILAVCSKNDEANALAPFDQHPEMLLKRSDIACIAANWEDKATNLRGIAKQLNIGLDSLVFVDDNPFERELVRRELPMVAVPEVPEDPALFAACLADAGYFESRAVTNEDRERSGQYQANLARAALEHSATDLPTYLRSLEMQLLWRPFDRVGLSRTVQLINKTNQFNLTTRRYSEDDVLAVMDDPRAFGLQLRLLDRFGDNGIIAIIIGRMQNAGDLLIDSWLMSCRVLGRGVEPTTLNLVAEQARLLGAKRLLGDYIATAKNGMVEDHYVKLGFTEPTTIPENGARRSVLELTRFVPVETFIETRQG
jgi:FkbH-like protein